MDPVSIVLAASTFVSLAKDLFDISTDVTSFCKDMRNADKLLQRFRDECRILSSLLQRLSDPRFQEAYTVAAIQELGLHVTKLQRQVGELRNKSRIQKAFSLRKLKQLLRDVESAEGHAMLALQLIIAEISFDTRALLENRPSNNVLAVHEIMKEVPKEVTEEPVVDVHPVRSRPRGTIWKQSVPVPIASRILTFVLEGSYREWTWIGLTFWTCRVIPTGHPVLLAIKAQDAEQLQRYLDLGEVDAGDIVTRDDSNGPREYLLRNTPYTLLEHTLRKSRSYRLPAIVASRVNKDRDMAVLRSLTAMAALRRGGTGYRWLLCTFNLDAHLAWFEGHLGLHLADLDCATLPLSTDVKNLEFLAARFAQTFQRPHCSLMHRISATDATITCSEAHALFGLNPSNVEDWPQQSKNWMLTHAICMGEMEVAESMIRGGASALEKTLHDTLLDGVMVEGTPWCTNLKVRHRQWLCALARAGIDTENYVRHMEMKAPREVHRNGIIDEYMVSLQMILPDDLRLAVWWRLDHSRPSPMPGSMPGSWSQELPILHSYLGTESDKIVIPLGIHNLDDTRTLLGYHASLGVQDDHGVVARTYRRRHHRRASQPPSVKGATWKLEGEWQQHCHICPWGSRMVHWSGPNVANHHLQLSKCRSGSGNHALERHWWLTLKAEYRRIGNNRLLWDDKCG